ncbi:MAG: SGNH/GDSL hydrolase family protein [Pseudomonadota bacterium]
MGDSDTVGYGNLSVSRDCTGGEVFFLTDAQAAYGPQVASHFDAEYQTLAISGIGVVRNHGGDNPAPTMPALYPPTPAEAASIADWSPEVVVSTLGSNDFATPLAPGEAWPDPAALQRDFVTNYGRFVKMLRSRYPDALLVLISIKGYEADYLEAHSQVLEELRSGGEDNIVLGVLPEMDRTGCHRHPSRKDHRMLADETIALIEAQPNVWRD